MQTCRLGGRVGPQRAAVRRTGREGGMPEQGGTTMNPREHERVAVNVSAVTIVINVALSLFKFAAGILARPGPWCPTPSTRPPTCWPPSS
jgi:hypothetical protein